MQSLWRWSVSASIVAILWSGLHEVGGAQAPQVPYLSAQNIPYLSGQSVVPVFEGWEHKRDGTFDMVFGYMNRNYQQELSVPVGRENSLEPGGPDRGQPTFFYSRRNGFQFRVNVPKDWGTKELVWTLTANGVTEKAVGSLMPVWEIDLVLEVMNSGPRPRVLMLDRNAPPSVVVEPVTAVTLPGTATLIASVTDDGLPPPPPRASVRREPVFLNAPLPREPGPPRSLSLNWIQFRGPRKVTFEPEGWVPVKSGDKAVRTARFSEPGTYVLRAIAHDSMVQTNQDITVTVSAPPAHQ
jgi:hypothetical protein